MFIDLWQVPCAQDKNKDKILYALSLFFLQSWKLVLTKSGSQIFTKLSMHEISKIKNKVSISYMYAY